MAGLVSFLVRIGINAAALLLVANLIEGFNVAGWRSALIAALVLGIVNAFIRPILALLTLPVNILSLGFFTFIINAALLLLVANVVEGFEIVGFASALVGAIVLWAVSLITNTLLHAKN